MSNFITRWFRRNAKGPERVEGEQYSTPATYAQASAAPVTFDSAMTVSAFWACVRLLTETVAALPLDAFRISGNTKTKDLDYQLWRVINFMPNRYQTRVEYLETLMLNLTTDGNAYSAIQRGVNGSIVSLIPLMSAQMQVILLDDGSITYEYTEANGNIRIYAEESIWHLKLFGNGIIGLSPLAYARQSLGIAIAIDNRVSTLAGNGGKTTGILTIDKMLTPEQRKQVKKKFEGLEAGNNDGLFVLEAGFDYKQTSLSPADMQMLESRRFQVEDICRFMGVPSILVNDTSGTTAWGSGINQIMDGFYKINLRPYLERFEASWTRSLMPVTDWGNVVMEFNFDALLRADLKSRTEAAKSLVNSGLLTPNEGRQQEGLPPKPGGDDIYLNGTMVPAGTTGNTEGSNNG